MADVTAEAAIAARNYTINRGLDEAARLTGARILWPASLTGDGFPCRATTMTNAAKLQEQGAGISLFDDVQVMVSRRWFNAESGEPEENQAIKFKSATDVAWRHMKINIVETPPGGAALILHLNNLSEGA